MNDVAEEVDPGFRALSFRQPWASAIIQGLKPLENRKYPPYASIVGERIGVHASLVEDEDDEWGLRKLLEETPLDKRKGAIDPLTKGVLLGTVKVTGFVRVNPAEGTPGSVGLTEEQAEELLTSKWRVAESPFLWLLEEPRILPDPIPHKGALGFWAVRKPYDGTLRSL